ncbi:MAG: tRNA glutamyl-Q(34) synthetase GluQRS [Roseobacter sp.]
MTFRTRFAPSPTGPLHLGHAYSACLAYDMARAAGGTFLLRIEDIDQSRARSKWESQIHDDLAWLGVDFPPLVLKQSERLPPYRAALSKLDDMGLTYPCFCSRRDIQQAISAPQEGIEPTMGPDGHIYPGTCRELPKIAHQDHAPALRLNMAKATEYLTDIGAQWPLSFRETGNDTPQQIFLSKQDAIQCLGDIVLARQNMGTSYHLSVVLDDAEQDITHVIRGADLFEATKIHLVLQKLLGLTTPIYHHHKLIRDEAGKRLAKRDDARAISLYRDGGYTPTDLRRMLGLWA